MVGDRRLMQLLAEHLREITLRQGNVPRRTGNLYKSIVARVLSATTAVVGTNVVYARAVHDGRPPMVIRPVRTRALAWKGAPHPVRAVRHPGIRPNPYLARAAARFAAEPLPPVVRAYLGEAMARRLEAHLRGLGLEVR